MSQRNLDSGGLRRQEYVAEAVRLRSYAAIAQTPDARDDFAALAAMYEMLAAHSVGQPTSPNPKA